MMLVFFLGVSPIDLTLGGGGVPQRTWQQGLFILQTEEERVWFAAAFETRDNIEISNGRKVALAQLMLRSQVRLGYSFSPVHH